MVWYIQFGATVQNESLLLQNYSNLYSLADQKNLTQIFCFFLLLHFELKHFVELRRQMYPWSEVELLTSIENFIVKATNPTAQFLWGKSI